MVVVHPVYRYRSFAERLGPKNAKNIIFHYVGVMVVVYITLTIRSMIIGYSEDNHYFALPPPTPKTSTTPKPVETTKAYADEDDPFEYPEIDLHPYWSGIICNISGSRNVLTRLIRMYVKYSSYYFTVAVGVLDTMVMLLLSKHLWKALRINPKKLADVPEERLKLITHCGETVSIEIGEDLACMDDNFVIEVILAALEFFRVSDKQD
eukprot:maker-scaffold456_size166325-snap-gene-0.20 protein:Tk11177 transcript:maker-scaffold456_size166325-snap-gene-0.20-mRNA-1 annotation:"Uncharacterized protein TCM_039720"